MISAEEKKNVHTKIYIIIMKSTRLHLKMSARAAAAACASTLFSLYIITNTFLDFSLLTIFY